MDNHDMDDFSILEDQNDGLDAESSGFPLPSETIPLRPDTPLYSASSRLFPRNLYRGL